jgi:hypothetical protein
MRAAVATLILAPALLLALACSDPDVAYPGHGVVLAEVDTYGPVEMSRLRRSARESGDEERIFVVALAAYIFDPVRFEQPFVEAFPAERAMSFVYAQLEEPRLTPTYLYSFSELGRVALEGDPAAIAKLLAVASQADGVVAAVVCDSLLVAFGVHAGTILRALNDLAPTQRQGAYACFAAASPDIARSSLEILEVDRGNAPAIATELHTLLAR